MNEFIIHSIPGSPFGRAVLVTLQERAPRTDSPPWRPAHSALPSTWPGTLSAGCP
jgi:hypothetical protein